jgi:hypothetical protein
MAALFNGDRLYARHINNPSFVLLSPRHSTKVASGFVPKAKLVNTQLSPGATIRRSYTESFPYRNPKTFHPQKPAKCTHSIRYNRNRANKSKRHQSGAVFLLADSPAC